MSILWPRSRRSISRHALNAFQHSSGHALGRAMGHGLGNALGQTFGVALGLALLFAAFDSEASPESLSAPAVQEEEAAGANGDSGADLSVEAHHSLLVRVQRSQAAGALGEALATSDRALELAQSLGDPLRVAATYSLRAQILAELGRTIEARTDFERALAESESSPALWDSIVLNLANLDAHSDRLAEARDAYQKIFERASARGDGELAARAGANALRADVELDASRFDLERVEALVVLVTNDSTRDSNGSSSSLLPSSPATAASQARLLIHLAHTVELARDQGVEPQAELLLRSNALLRQALTLAEAPDAHTLRAEALGRLALLYADQGHIDEAVDLTRRALVQARRGQFVVPVYRLQVQAGDLFARQGNLDEAIDQYADAIRLLGPIRTPLAEGGETAIRGLSFEHEIGRTYRREVDLLLQRASGQTEADRRRADIEQARTVLEDFKVAELRDYFEDDCVDEARSRQNSIEGAAADAAVIYPIVLDDRLEIILSKGDRLESIRVEVSRVALEAEVERFRVLLEDRTSRRYLRPAQQLHAWLIAPLSSLLAEMEPNTLVFVPDGVLRTIPIAALHDGKQHLVEQIALATTPSLDLTDPRPLDRDQIGALYAGLTGSVQGFTALPQVKQELEIARALIPGEILLDDSFSKQAFVARLSEKNFDIVHIASHAEFGGEDRGGFLLTHDGRLSLEELRNAVGLLRYRSRPLELLVLSACQTAVGDDRAALGLSGAAVQAGARSVLGSLWTVQDEATAQLIATFYEGLKDPTVSRAEALRRAQIGLLEKTEYRHPLNWAPFLLINNWL